MLFPVYTPKENTFILLILLAFLPVGEGIGHGQKSSNPGVFPINMSRLFIRISIPAGCGSIMAEVAFRKRLYDNSPKSFNQ
jgi:hypothetical protein